MQIFPAVFVALLAFFIGVNCGNLEYSTTSENETKSRADNRCVEKCGRDPDVTCVGDLTSEANIICGCRDETETYDEKSHQCIDRCVEKCGDDPEINCEGDQTSNETTICSCINETMMYDTRNRKCGERCAVKCGKYSSITCEGDQTSDETTICVCTNKKYVYNDGSCSKRCYEKCGIARCIGDETSDETIVCHCNGVYEVFDEKSKKCKERCIVKCGVGPYVTCSGDKKTDETTLCGCNRKNRIFDEESLTCIKRCTKKCGWDSNIECVGDQMTDETTICGCRDTFRIYDEENQTCKDIPCASDPCRNGGNCTVEGDTYKCVCPEYYGGKDCSENLVCDIHGEEICGKAKCHYNEHTLDIDCICEDGEVFDILTDRCIVDHCALEPCQNGGRCTNREDKYRCSCGFYFTGQNCSESRWCLIHGRRECGDASCQYDVVSQNVSCTCPSNEVFDEKLKTCKGVCKPNPCIHGICVDDSKDGFSCTCFSTYRGKFCNETRPDPCTPNPCKNGGSCLEYGSKFICFCGINYSGNICEHENNTVLTLCLLLLGAGAFIFVCCGVFLLKRRQKLKRMSEPTEIYQVPPIVMPVGCHQSNIHPSASRN